MFRLFWSRSGFAVGRKELKDRSEAESTGAQRNPNSKNNSKICLQRRIFINVIIVFAPCASAELELKRENHSPSSRAIREARELLLDFDVVLWISLECWLCSMFLLALLRHM